MKIDEEKSKAELIEDLNILRKKLSELESFQSEYERAKYLASNSEYHQLIAELSEDMFSVHNPEGAYIYASPASNSIFGYNPKELIGRSAYDFFHSEDFRRIAEHHETTTKGKVPPPVTYRLRHKKGHFVWVETTNRFIYDPGSNEVVMIICVTRDVTRQKASYRKWEESEMRFRNIIENTPVGMCITDENGNFQYVNDAYCKIYDYSESELLGKHFSIIVPDETKELLTQKHDDFINGQDEVKGIWKVIDKNNNLRYITSDAVRISGTDGKYKKVTFVNDITELENYKNELKESRERLSQIADSINEIFWLSSPDNVEYLSPAFERITGYSADEVINDPKFYSSIVHPEDKEEYFYQGYQEDMTYGRDVVYRIITKDGQIRWLRSTSNPVRNAEGEVIKVAGVTRDITDIHEAQDEQKRSKEKYKMLFNNSNDAIFVHGFHNDGRPSNFIEVNESACMIYGYTKEEFMNISALELDADLPEEKLRSIVKELYSNSRAVFKSIHRTKSGREIPVEVSSQIFTMNNETIVISLIRDISHFKNAEEQLRKAKEAADQLNHLKSIIIANMSHELRTPLNAIINYADILMNSCKDDDYSIQIIKEIKDSGVRLHKTLTTMLDLSKIESDTTRLNFEARDLSQTVKEMLDYFKDDANKKGIYLKLVCLSEGTEVPY
jgi:PAS domain S-box-containing protein